MHKVPGKGLNFGCNLTCAQNFGAHRLHGAERLLHYATKSDPGITGGACARPRQRLFAPLTGILAATEQVAAVRSLASAVVSAAHIEYKTSPTLRTLSLRTAGIFFLFFLSFFFFVKNSENQSHRYKTTAERKKTATVTTPLSAIASTTEPSSCPLKPFLCSAFLSLLTIPPLPPRARKNVHPLTPAASSSKRNTTRPLTEITAPRAAGASPRSASWTSTSARRTTLSSRPWRRGKPCSRAWWRDARRCSGRQTNGRGTSWTLTATPRASVSAGWGGGWGGVMHRIGRAVAVCLLLSCTFHFCEMSSAFFFLFFSRTCQGYTVV